MFKELVRKIMDAINGNKPADKGTAKPAATGKSAVIRLTGDAKFEAEVLKSTVPVVVLFGAPGARTARSRRRSSRRWPARCRPV